MRERHRPVQFMEVRIFVATKIAAREISFGTGDQFSGASSCVALAVLVLASALAPVSEASELVQALATVPASGLVRVGPRRRW